MINRKLKIAMLNHYEGDKCVCGKAKRKKHWLCAACRTRFKDTPEGKELDRTCAAHTAAGYAYLDRVKRDLANQNISNQRGKYGA